ncbi:hypothetical protein Hanom_Chr09g00848611 [Helianthus anomalus]
MDECWKSSRILFFMDPTCSIPVCLTRLYKSPKNLNPSIASCFPSRTLISVTAADQENPRCAYASSSLNPQIKPLQSFLQRSSHYNHSDRSF